MEIRGENRHPERDRDAGREGTPSGGSHGLRNAKRLLNDVKKGKVGRGFHRGDGVSGRLCGWRWPAGESGAGREEVACEGLYSADKALQLRRSQDNPYLNRAHGVHQPSPSHHVHRSPSEAFEGEVSLSRASTRSSGRTEDLSRSAVPFARIGQIVECRGRPHRGGRTGGQGARCRPYPCRSLQDIRSPRRSTMRRSATRRWRASCVRCMRGPEVVRSN